MQKFISRECLATPTYTESKALDLYTESKALDLITCSILSAEWRHEFRRLVDERFGHGGTLLPFKLTLLSQIPTTTCVEYTAKLCRIPPGPGHSTSSTSRSAPSAIMRGVEEGTNNDDMMIDVFLPDDNAELVLTPLPKTSNPVLSVLLVSSWGTPY